jgi:hypothetical protein
MQDSASPGGAQGEGQGEGQGQRKLSPVVAGVGAAVIAACVTLVVMMSNTTTTTTDQVASAKQCPAIQRRLLVSTTHGSGTIRFRASGWLSAPFTLTTQPQVVIFPLLRSETTPVAEAIMVEGDATDVVITSEVTDLHKVFDVKGTYPYPVTWAPKKGC